jgi:transcriptional regulator with XRE-family HTH domain
MDEIMPSKIAQVRKQKGFSIRSLARKVGCSHTYLAEMEKSDDVSLQWLQRIAIALDCTTLELMDLPEVDELLQPYRDRIRELEEKLERIVQIAQS